MWFSHCTVPARFLPDRSTISIAQRAYRKLTGYLTEYYVFAQALARYLIFQSVVLFSLAERKKNNKIGKVPHSPKLKTCGAAMYHPTGRALTVLELLQSRPSITGPELADRLEMDVRTVRRYITILQDIGIPIEGMIGRHGGYRLRPGFKLPPLMFTEEEATAIALGLLGTAWLEIGLSAAAIEGALAKVSRVLPQRARERMNAVAAHMILIPAPASGCAACRAADQSERGDPAAPADRA
jgi:biotin operon repressor